MQARALLVLGAFLALGAAPAESHRAPIQQPAHGLPLGKLLGQRIMIGMNGTAPDSALLRAVQAGQVGAVILFAPNIVSRSQVTALTRSLQRAARRGGNPPLLIAVDQEGGQVKRFPHGPPDLSPPQIAATGSTAVATREGRATGKYLKGVGVNMNLAPVVDVPTFPGAFIWREGRAFSFNAGAVARFGTAFALGLQSAGVAATAKHFPGVGSAASDTDTQRDVLRPSKAQAAAALKPYRALIPHGLDAVMVSTAAYPRYDRTGTPASLSRPIAQGLLRKRLNFKGVVITDALSSPTGHSLVKAGLLAARAGVDILLYVSPLPAALGALETAVRRGWIRRSDAEASYQRIVALKRRVANG